MNRLTFAVLADVHGNLPAIDAVIADARAHQVDHFIFVGDYVRGGPFPAETLARMRSLGGWQILGNTDTYFLRYHDDRAPRAWYTHQAWATLRWCYERLAAADLAHLRALPEQLVIRPPAGTPLRIVHGSPRSASENILPNDKAAANRFVKTGLVPSIDDSLLFASKLQVAESVLVCGHSHIPWKQARPGGWVLNPGSVGASIIGDPGAQYALLAWQDGAWRVEQRAVDYDVAAASAAYEETGFLAAGGALARAFQLNVSTGRNVIGWLTAHVRRFAGELGYQDVESVSGEVWDRAVAAFDWDAAVRGE